MSSVVGSYEWMLGAQKGLKLLQDKDAERERLGCLSEKATGQCYECGGYGFHQFCGDAICQRCGGSGRANIT